MINIGIVCDVTWDNYILIHNKFKKLSNDNHRLHFLYNKNLEILCNCANNNHLTVIRNSSNTLSDNVYNLLKVCDFWIIFTNCIEYLTLPYLIIDKCDEHLIKYLRVSERLDDYYSFDNNEKTFKKTLLNLQICTNKNNIEQFNYNDYNDNFNTIKKELILNQEIKDTIRLKYSNLEDNKKNKQIQLLYDKDEYKTNKQAIKQAKQYSTMIFAANRKNYYKNNK